MRKFFLPIIFILTALACNVVTPQSTPTPTQISPTAAPTKAQPAQGNLPQTQDDVPRVTVKDAKDALDSGQAIIVDVRSAEVYAASHIAGAVSIPLAEIESNPAGVKLDKNKWIITYCT